MVLPSKDAFHLFLAAFRINLRRRNPRRFLIRLTASEYQQFDSAGVAAPAPQKPADTTIRFS